MAFRLRSLACFAALLLSGCVQQSSVQHAGHVYSTVIPVALGDWKPGANTAGQTGFVVDVPMAQIDQSVVDGGGVAVYYRFKGAERYEPLPLVFNGVIYHAYHSKGMLWLRMFSASGGNLGAKPPPEVTDLEAKVVIF